MAAEADGAVMGTAIAESDWKAELFPTLGFFGLERVTSLQLALERPVKAIRLCIDTGVAEFVSLRGIQLWSGDKPLNLAPLVAHAQQSSFHPSQKVQDPLLPLTLGWLHSKTEIAPTWEVEFTSPVEANELRVLNRPDGKGLHAAKLHVSVRWENGSWALLHQGGSDQSYELALAAAIACLRGGEVEDMSALSASEWRNVLTTRIADTVTDPSVPLDAFDWPLVIQLVPFWTSGIELDDPQITMIAGMSLWYSNTRQPKGVKAFSRNLDTETKVLRLQNEIQRIASLRGMGKYLITRHGVTRSNLLSRKDEYLVALDCVLGFLEMQGREPMLAYGTLLGAVREQQFIAHDDDVDLLYTVRAGDMCALRREVDALQVAFVRAGFRVHNLMPASFNMHVTHIASNVSIDVFPLWGFGGQMSLHMERMEVRELPSSIFLPRGVIDFNGRELPVPADPERFLCERYGAGWTESDQFHEWPWQLLSEPVA